MEGPCSGDSYAPQKASLYCWGSYSAKGMKNFQYLSRPKFGDTCICICVFLSLSSHPFVSISPAYTFSPCCSFCFRWARKSRKEAWGSCGRHLYLHLSITLWMEAVPLSLQLSSIELLLSSLWVGKEISPVLLLVSLLCSWCAGFEYLVPQPKVASTQNRTFSCTWKGYELSLVYAGAYASIFRSWPQFYLEPSKVLAVKTLKPSNLTIQTCA